jgi:hypothetical protein
MSNKLTTNPIILDTFNADFLLSANPATVKKVVLFSATAGDVFSLIHGSSAPGNEGIRLIQNSGKMAEIDFNGAEQIFPNGLFFSAADNVGLDSGADRVLIYLK